MMGIELLGLLVSADTLQTTESLRPRVDEVGDLGTEVDAVCKDGCQSPILAIALARS